MKKTSVILSALIILVSAIGTGAAHDYIELPIDEFFDDPTVVSEHNSSSHQTTVFEEETDNSKTTKDITDNTKTSLTEPTVTETITTITEPTVKETKTASTQESSTEPTETAPTQTETKTEITYTKPSTEIIAPTQPAQPKKVKISNLKLNYTHIHLAKNGNNKTLKVTITPNNATNKTLKWTVTNKNISNVNQSGKVTAKSNGYCYIKAEAKDGSKKSVKCSLLVGQYVKSIKLPKNIAVKKGKTKTIKAQISNKSAAYKALNWKSSNLKIATVNISGKVKALNKGNCNITATAKDGSKKSAKCKVLVR